MSQTERPASLEALREAIQQLEAIEATKTGQIEQAMSRLHHADRESMLAMLQALEDEFDFYSEVTAAAEHLENPAVPAYEAAWAWRSAINRAEVGVPFPAAPPGVVGYCTLQAAHHDGCRARFLNGAPLPVSVRWEVLDAATRWTAAQWRYLASLADVVGKALQS